jgi:DNA-binding HxlR family transcriptional regulator
MVALGGRVKADQLTQALEELEASGVVIREQGPSTGGRRPEFWRLNPQSALSA